MKTLDTTQRNMTRRTVWNQSIPTTRLSFEQNATVLNILRRSLVARKLTTKCAALLHKSGVCFLQLFKLLFEPLLILQQERDALAENCIDRDARKKVGNVHSVVMPNDGAEP